MGRSFIVVCPHCNSDVDVTFKKAASEFGKIGGRKSTSSSRKKNSERIIDKQKTTFNRVVLELDL